MTHWDSISRPDAPKGYVRVPMSEWTELQRSTVAEAARGPFRERVDGPGFFAAFSYCAGQLQVIVYAETPESEP